MGWFTTDRALKRRLQALEEEFEEQQRRTRSELGRLWKRLAALEHDEDEDDDEEAAPEVTVDDRGTLTERLRRGLL